MSKKNKKNQLTEIIFILDKSFSMGPVAKETIEGYNQFVKEQKKVPGKANITLALFSDEGKMGYSSGQYASSEKSKYELRYVSKPLKEVPKLTEETYVVDGWTALHDAIGKTVYGVDKRVNKLSKKDQPDNFICVILTDGQENSSKEFNRAKVNELIKQKREKNWEFIFLGADQDALEEAANLGMSMGNAMSYANTSTGTKKAMSTFTAGVSRYRNAAATMDAVAFADACMNIMADVDDDAKEQLKKKKAEGSYTEK